MATSSRLLEKATELSPIDVNSPSTLAVAILKPGKTSEDELVSDDFIWMKGNSKVRLAKIRLQYKKRCATNSWILVDADGKPIDLNDVLGSYCPAGQDIIVFQTAKPTTAQISSPALSTVADYPLSPKDGNARPIPASVPKMEKTVNDSDENAMPRWPSPRANMTNWSPTTHAQPNLGGPVMPIPSYMRSQAPHAKGTPPPSSQYRNQILGGILPPPASHQTAQNIPVRSEMPQIGVTEPSPSGIVKGPDILNEFSEQGFIRSSSPSPSQCDEEERQQKAFQLARLFKDATPSMLEKAVESSAELLDILRAPMNAKLPDNTDAEQWIKQIDALRKQAVKTRTIIGVVGNTGAGKSSVINALLDEERLVPTNCMRACTAVVTEISYNYEAQSYRAEIEFISAADWEKELNILFQDLLDGEGNVSRECTNEDSDAGIAYAKIKAVYPQKTKEDIANSNIPALLKEVRHILDSNQCLKETDSMVFYKKLQSYVDSKEKFVGKKGKDGKKEKREREYWPLIRVVRLFVRSSALATGAVIVDLPGVHDANAARAAVAEGYMKQCTGLWIVAPINRAVDDKAAKSLLGDSFKRQLKMDGGFSSVTFICSKTDDISLTEAQDSLGLDEKMIPSWEEVDDISSKQKAMKKQLEEVVDSKTVYEEVANDVEEEIESWEMLQASMNSGEIVYAPKQKAGSKKRKKENGSQGSSKRRRKDDSDAYDSDFIDDGSDSEKAEQTDLGEDIEDDAGKEALTEEQISDKLAELKKTKKHARNQKQELVEKAKEIRQELKVQEEAKSRIESEMSALCISGRNGYSKGAIQQDFAAGIKELDQEIAAEEDEDNFNPDEEARDYDEVAKSLTVFCVSSKGYQKLQGRLRKEPTVPGFSNIQETEIPMLQAHCEKLTETGRAANCRSFINKLSQLLNSLSIWASSDGTGAQLTPEQKAREAKLLQRDVERLETSFENATKAVCREFKDELAEHIFEKFETAVSAAARDSVETASKWGAPVVRENRAAGGLYWATYKAVCRRNGVFTNGQGLHDWNAQLTEPVIKLIAPGWEKVFTRRISLVMNNFSKAMPVAIKKFHVNVNERARKLGSGIAGLSLLSNQIAGYEHILKDVATSTKEMMITRQKDINRGFVPVVGDRMLPTYEWCATEVGPGQFKRMKSHMIDFVNDIQTTMFQESVDEVQRQLTTLLKDVGNDLADKTDEVFVQIKRDYRSVVGGGTVPQDGALLSRVERQVRRETKQSIEGVEERMKRVLDPPNDAESPQTEDNKDFALSDDEKRGVSPAQLAKEDGKDSTATKVESGLEAAGTPVKVETQEQSSTPQESST